MNKPPKVATVVFLLCACTLTTRAQSLYATDDIRFERAAIEQHLPQSSAYDILEDGRGFLWFATREGVGRWDGYEMQTWKHDPFDEASLPGNVVFHLLEDAAGDIWTTSKDYLQREVGIARIAAPDYASVQRYGFPGARAFRGHDGALRLATADSLYRYDRQRDRFLPMHRRAFAGSEPRRGYTDGDGGIWILTGDGRLEVCVQTTCRPVEIPVLGPGIDVRSGAFFEDAAGHLWVGVMTDRIARFDRGRNSWERCDVTTGVQQSRRGGAPPGLIVDMERGPSGAIWVLAQGGVYRVDEACSGSERFPLLVLGEQAENLAPTSLLFDRAGNLWTGTVWGVYRWVPGGQPFRHVQHRPDDPTSLSAGLVTSLLEDDSGAIWAGTIGGGLNRIDRRTGGVIRYRAGTAPGSLSSDVVWTLAQDHSGKLWVGTDRGLDRFDAESGRFEHFRFEASWPATRSLLDPNSVTGIVVGEDGRFWIGVLGGRLMIFDPSDYSHEYVSELADYRVGYGAVDSTGALWLDTGLGVYTFGTGPEPTLQRPPGFTDRTYDGILAFHHAPDGTTWMGSNSGLYRYDRSRAQVENFTKGLPSGTVYGILEDGSGRLWLSTNRGLASLDPSRPAGEGLRIYDHTSGLENTEFNRLSWIKARDGTMFFGGDRGITWFHPDRVVPNPYVPPVVLTAFRKSSRDGSTVLRTLPGSSIELAPDDYTFTFEFAALNYVNPDKNRFAVMLEGVDPDWVDLGTRRQKSYTNVPPGRYTFRVKGSNDDGLWNEAGISVPVLVRPAFWQTAWFRFAVVTGGLFLVGLVVWSLSQRRYQRRIAALQAQQALEAERSRISRDMHDEVGASLTEIAILSELARQFDGPETGTRLQKIAATSREMLDAINEIIWAINPRNDTLERLASYLREHVGQYFEETEIAYRVDFPERLPDVSLSAEFRRNVFLFVKEALHNVVRHSGAREVSLTLHLAGPVLTVRIEDNGHGFDVAGAQGHGNGLRNMRHRAKEIGGTLRIDSRPDRGGAVLCLECPLPEQALLVPAGGGNRANHHIV